MKAQADLHIHSCFSMASSASMLPPLILNACRKKGILVQGSGDALHPEWRRYWEETDNGDIIVIPTTEVEDNKRVHHLIIFEDFESFSDLADALKKDSKTLDNNGRPRIYLSGNEIARSVHKLDGLIGPAHAFTPWTSIYAFYDSIADCYGSESIEFLELGLSADSSYGAAIKELVNVPFLSNSDAHSPSPDKIGREWTSLEIQSHNIHSVIESIREGKIIENVGLFPELGKYNQSACIRCYRSFGLEEAKSLMWKCPVDKGRIKKGVHDRGLELSSGTDTSPRPPYIHMVPLSEIIMRTLGTASSATKGCRSLYDSFIELFKTETEILIEIKLEELSKVNNHVAESIVALREGKVNMKPGGGGQYGSFDFIS